MNSRLTLSVLAALAALPWQSAPGQWPPPSFKQRTFPASVPTYPIVNGQLYRETSAAPVYLAQDWQLFWIPTPNALTIMGLSGPGGSPGRFKAIYRVWWQ